MKDSISSAKYIFYWRGFDPFHVLIDEALIPTHSYLFFKSLQSAAPAFPKPATTFCVRHRRHSRRYYHHYWWHGGMEQSTPIDFFRWRWQQLGWLFHCRFAVPVVYKSMFLRSSLSTAAARRLSENRSRSMQLVSWKQFDFLQNIPSVLA